MQLSALSLALFASLSLAQFSGLPTCAQGCASQQFSGGSYAGCGTDPKCICQNQSFLGNVACCLVGACDDADQTSAIAFATQICQAQGVTVPTVVSCSTATSAAASLGSGSAATASATGTSDGGSAATASATSSTVASSGSTAGAWAPRQTAAMGMEMLGLAAAGAGMVFM